MFDRLVESTSTGAELKPRRRIFAATLVLVTTLFAVAIVASIYAADYDLGTSNFDIAELLTPVTETEPPREPEPQPQQRNSNLPQSANNQIVRPLLMLSTDESTKIPDKTSTEVNPYATTRYRDIGSVTIGELPSDPDPNAGPTGPGGGSSSSNYPTGNNLPDDAETKPPPPVKKPEVKPPTPSLGVINGKAKSLPHPPYSQAAQAVGAGGAVNVQVTIDENGNVISAKAVSGHLMLRRASEEAARRAKFTTTYLSNVPVKVTGVIVYNFKKN